MPSSASVTARATRDSTSGRSGGDPAANARLVNASSASAIRRATSCRSGATVDAPVPA